MSLGKIGFERGNPSDEAMVLDAIKELYKLQGDIMTDREETYYKEIISKYTKYDCLNRLRKLNRNIKKMGGTEIKRKTMREIINAKLNK